LTNGPKPITITKGLSREALLKVELCMSTLEQQELKHVVKEAIKEVMAENSEMLKELVVETLEEIALIRRMEEGRQTEFVSRDVIMDMLEPKH
jgi:mevalonate kinase